MNKQSQTEPVTFSMFKTIGGRKVHSWQLNALSDEHAITVATNSHRNMGLIGRYYCETSTGKTFVIQ